MLAGADDLAGRAARASDEKGAPAEAGSAELGREVVGQGSTFTAIGALAGAIVEMIGQDRATRIAPREMVRAPAGEVARAGRRRYVEG